MKFGKYRQILENKIVINVDGKKMPYTNNVENLRKQLILTLDYRTNTNL